MGCIGGYEPIHGDLACMTSFMECCFQRHLDPWSWARLPEAFPLSDANRSLRQGPPFLNGADKGQFK